MILIIYCAVALYVIMLAGKQGSLVDDYQKGCYYNFLRGCAQQSNCPGLTCGIIIVKPRFLYKTVDLWSHIMLIDR